MKRQIKTIVVAAASIALTVVNNIPAQAGGHGGGGFRHSVGRSHISSHFSHHAATRHHHHTYRRPVCAQRPIVQLQPNQLQPVQLQPNQPRPVQLQPNQPRPVQLQPVQPQPIQPVVRSNQVAINAPRTPQPAVQNNSMQVPVTSQRVTSQPAISSSTNTDESAASALAMLSSISTNETSAPQAPVTQAAAQVPEITAASSQTAGSHVGNWSASLSGNQSVTLALNEDGSFVWMATKDGKSSSFQGQFRLEDGRLTLVRSNDLQQMKGSWSGEADKFTFKLDGATTSGLAFARS